MALSKLRTQKEAIQQLEKTASWIAKLEPDKGGPIGKALETAITSIRADMVEGVN